MHTMAELVGTNGLFWFRKQGGPGEPGQLKDRKFRRKGAAHLEAMPTLVIAIVLS